MFDVGNIPFSRLEQRQAGFVVVVVLVTLKTLSYDKILTFPNLGGPCDYRIDDFITSLHFQDKNLFLV